MNVTFTYMYLPGFFSTESDHDIITITNSKDVYLHNQNFVLEAF